MPLRNVPTPTPTTSRRVVGVALKILFRRKKSLSFQIFEERETKKIKTIFKADRQKFRESSDAEQSSKLKIGNSVTRRLDFFDIWPIIYPMAYKICQSRSKFFQNSK